MAALVVGLRVVAAQTHVGILAEGSAVDVADRVDAMAHGVDRCLELGHVLAYVLAAHALLVHSVEIGVELKHDVFLAERLAAIGYVTHV